MKSKIMSEPNGRNVDFENIQSINANCDCVALEKPTLRNITTGKYRSVSPACPPAIEIDVDFPFANTPVFISRDDQMQMHRVVAAASALANQPAWQQYCATRSGIVLRPADNTVGVLTGFDFHLCQSGAKLIEINTNAGGAFLSQQMIAQHSDAFTVGLTAMHRWFFGHGSNIARALQDMFITEWQRAKPRNARLLNIAIVDDNPAAQFLFPDMLLAQGLLKNNHTNVFIVAANELQYQNGHLQYGGKTIDFVYNRLTDFGLTETANMPILHAWLDGAAVVSPAPSHHSWLADKRNLALMGDDNLSHSFGLSATQQADLQAAIPSSTILNASNRDELWSQRKQYYFKPITGYGSKAVYRGSKLTSKVWQQISYGTHIAQRQVDPMQRLVTLDNESHPQKFDLRVYAYDGNPIATVARLYNGQTTNMRTAGGGFAPVISLPSWAGSVAANCC